MGTVITRDARGRFVAGTGGSKKGPRSPKAKAMAWRRAVEKTMGGEMDPVDTALLDQLEAMMVRSFEGTMGTNERRDFIRALQAFKVGRKMVGAKRMSPLEKWQAKRGAA